MMNTCTFVGRIVKIGELEDNKLIITIAITRSYKNSEGIYDTDFIDIELYKGMAENTKEYCMVGDLVGVKAKIETIDNKMIIKAEKVSFLASKKQD